MKIQEIERCWDCKHFGETIGASAFCYKGKDKKLLRTGEEIPDWCPLDIKIIEPYGYIIEQTYKYKITTSKFIIPKTIEESFIDLYWNHKIYKKLKVAEESLKNIKQTSGDNYTFEIIPLYK